MELRIFTEPQQGATYDDQLALARLAEECGFGAFFRSDHYMAMWLNGGDGLPGPTDAWVTLAGLARETSTIRLGTLVTPATFRFPGPLAISVAQVDAMSGGRVELGLGAGWYEAEHAAYAIPFGTVKERFDRFEEQLEIVTGLWATPPGAHYSFQGDVYQVTDSPALPKPVQPELPIIVGGSGPKRTPALAARFATEFNVGFAPLADVHTQFERVRAACAAIGRDPATMVFSVALVACVGADEAEFTRRASAIQRDPVELREGGAAGTPDEAVAMIRACAALGAQRVYLQILDMADHDHLRLIAAEVRPRL
jgi:F420-dependent oxidoreductase-like protein